MSYQVIQPPFTLNFTEMTKEELQEYFAWFQSILEERVSELSAHVREDSLTSNWEPDHSPSSVEVLGEWLSRHVSTRPRTQQEQEQLTAGLSHPIAVPDYDLTNESFSLGMDIGIYFGLTLMKNHPSLRWDQDLKNKRFADYGQPIIIGFGAVPLNPVRIGINFAYGFASKKQASVRVREVYDVWSAKAQ